MKSLNYFSKCKSLSDVKKEYKKLAMANHPDRGGDVEIMKEINCQYRISFETHKRIEELSSGSVIDDGPRFYTPNGHQGVNYDPFMDIAVIAKHIRQYCKAVWSECRFSVRISRYSGGQSIHIEVKESPWRAFKDPSEFTDYEQMQADDYFCCTTRAFYTPEMERVLKDVGSFMESYNRSDSDSMVDYFDEFFYGFIQVASNHKVVYREPKVCKVAVAA